MTQYLFIKVPPQMCWRSVVCMDTIYLIEWGTGAYPPTMRSCAMSSPATNTRWGGKKRRASTTFKREKHKTHTQWESEHNCNSITSAAAASASTKRVIKKNSAAFLAQQINEEQSGVWATVTHTEVWPSLFIPCYITQWGDNTQTWYFCRVYSKYHKWNVDLLKGPIWHPFADLYFSFQTLVEQVHTNNYPPHPSQTSVYLQQTAYLARCLQPPAKKRLDLASC